MNRSLVQLSAPRETSSITVLLQLRTRWSRGQVRQIAQTARPIWATDWDLAGLGRQPGIVARCACKSFRFGGEVSWPICGDKGMQSVYSKFADELP